MTETETVKSTSMAASTSWGTGRCRDFAAVVLISPYLGRHCILSHTCITPARKNTLVAFDIFKKIHKVCPFALHKLGRLLCSTKFAKLQLLYVKVVVDMDIYVYMVIFSYLDTV